MIKALVIPLSKDIRPLSRLLWSESISHRISEKDGQQVVWVSREPDARIVQELYHRFQAGELDGQMTETVQQHSVSTPRFSLAQAWQYLLASPIVSVLILASMLATLLLYGVEQPVFFALRMGSLAYILESSEYWRLITPIFLHFGLMHLAFNLLMLWVFGHQIEMRGEKIRLLLLVFGSAALSNSAQYYVSGSGFGGMSGVVFAILAYCWMWDRLNPQQSYHFPPALMGLMMLWLALGFTNVLRSLGFGAIANTAHLVGLVFGLIFAWVITRVKRPV